MTEITESEWLKKGEELFGSDEFKWKFICPACRRIQSIEDFRKFKDMGANPNTAYQECIGRFTGGKKGPEKCDWASFGLFKGPITILTEGKKIFAFDFAPVVADK